MTLFLCAGDTRTGLWCDTCLLPARYEVDILLLTPAGVDRSGKVTRCAGCDDD